MATMRIKKTLDNVIFSVIAYTFLGVASIICLAPFLLVISGSISKESAITQYGYSIIPREISFEAYKMALAVPEDIIRAYGVTIFITVVGTMIALFLMSMAAYVLSRKDFEYRNIFSFFFYFTTLFSGGLVPWYILMVRYLKMEDNYLALIVPLLFNVFYIIILRSNMSTIPDSIAESAKMDGAGDFTIFIKLIVPLSKPVMASIGLFVALNYWNDWFNAMLFIDNEKMYPLQYFLYRLLSASQAIKNLVNKLPPEAAILKAPTETFKMAMTIITIGPIILLYPRLQKYFVKGIMVGAVKG